MAPLPWLVGKRSEGAVVQALDFDNQAELLEPLLKVFGGCRLGSVVPVP